MPPVLTETQQQELLKEVKMLQDYIQVLEAENTTRNEERKFLEREIDRLMSLEKNIGSSSPTSPNESSELSRMKAETLKLENQVERLNRENTNLQSSYNVLSETIAKYNSTSSTVTTISSKVDTSELNKKYQELSEKYDEINYENLTLKRENERLQQINYKGLEESIKRLESEKNSLNSTKISLESEIRSMKLTIESKETEIRNLKNKQTSSNESDIKILRDSLSSKEKEIQVLNSKISSVSILELEITNLKATLASRESEITRLKEQVNKDNEEANKIYKLETEIRSLKYQITSKDSEIQSLIVKTSSFSSEYSKITVFEKELKDAKSVILGKENDLNTLNKQIILLESECNSWKIKYEEEIRNHGVNKTSVSNTVSHYSEQIANFSNEISRMAIEMKEKDTYIVRIEDELKEFVKKDEFKNMEVSKLDRIVNSYMEKIGELEIELNRLEKNSANGSASMNDGGLMEENRVLNEKILDLERRIAILEETNLSLREELKYSIEIRSRESSRIVVSQEKHNALGDEELLGTIKVLKMEIEEMRAYNTRLKGENEYYQAKLSSFELELNYLSSAYNRVDSHIEKSQKTLVAMPDIESSKFERGGHYAGTYDSKINTHNVLDESSREPQASFLGRQRGVETMMDVRVSNIRSKERERGYEKGYSKAEKSKIVNGHINSGVGRSGQFDDLQKKIQMLKQENKGLRRHLYETNS